ncbi:MAG: hypothetical protein R3C10_15520 [Pirellulales bacterium]
MIDDARAELPSPKQRDDALRQQHDRADRRVNVVIVLAIAPILLLFFAAAFLPNDWLSTGGLFMWFGLGAVVFACASYSVNTWGRHARSHPGKFKKDRSRSIQLAIMGGLLAAYGLYEVVSEWNIVQQ